MIRCLPILNLLVLLSMLPLTMKSQSIWKIWSNGSISLTSPGELKCGTKTHNSAENDEELLFDITTCVYQINADDAKAKTLPQGAIYMINILEYPEDFIHEDSVDIINEILGSSIPTTIAGHKTTVLYQNHIKYGNDNGITYRLSYNDGKMSVKTKAFYIRNKLITVQVYTAKGHTLHSSIDKFIDSFHYNYNK